MTLSEAAVIVAMRRCSPSERAAIRQVLGRLYRGEVAGEPSRASKVPPGTLRLRVPGHPLWIFYRPSEAGPDLMLLKRIEAL